MSRSEGSAGRLTTGIVSTHVALALIALFVAAVDAQVTEVVRLALYVDPVVHMRTWQ